MCADPPPSQRAVRVATLALLLAASAAAPRAEPAGPSSAGPLAPALAARGVPARSVPACASCHGAQGEGNAAAGFPRLAAQSQKYLARQMRSFADGSRPSPVMTPIAKALTRAQTEAIAAHYAALAPAQPASASAASAAPAASAPAGDAALARGAVLATVGEDSVQLQACANCHGPGGSGEPPALPYLAAQPANYLGAALVEWKSGRRKTDPSGQMTAIAARLSDADVAAVAAYYAAQPPVAPRPRLTPPKLPPLAAGRKSQAPSVGGAGSRGTGTESGSPLTGGGQGPGGGGGTSGTDPTRKSP